jgi:hypothetical protein
MSDNKISLDLALNIFTQATSGNAKKLIDKIEKLKNPLASMGFYGVESGRQHYKINRILPELNLIKKVCEKIEKILSEK